VLQATRAAFPKAIVTFDADSAGADPHGPVKDIGAALGTLLE
jgi:hypothetical protein